MKVFYGLGWLLEKSNRTVHKVVFEQPLDSKCEKLEQVRVNYCSSGEKSIKFGGKEFPFDASEWTDKKGNTYIHYLNIARLEFLGKYQWDFVSFKKYVKAAVYSVPKARVILPDEHDSVRISKDLKAVFSGSGMYGLAMLLMGIGFGVAVGLLVGYLVLPMAIPHVTPKMVSLFGIA